MSRRCFVRCVDWKPLGQQLFEKSRAGYLPTSLAQALAEQAERAEQALEAARIGVEQGGEVISGTVRLTCTDSVLQGLLLPALARFMPNYPALTIELSTSNDFANLSRRDADIALRLTRTPPEHLVGRRLAAVLTGCAPARVICNRSIPMTSPH
jgi:DNA-binding transcriptional LysR family regulator